MCLLLAMHLRELDNAFSTVLNDKLMKRSLNDYGISSSNGTSINVLSLDSGMRRESGRSRHQGKRAFKVKGKILR